MNAARGIWPRRLIAIIAVSAMAASNAAGANRQLQEPAWEAYATDEGGMVDEGGMAGQCELGGECDRGSCECGSQCDCGNMVCQGCCPPWQHFTSAWGEFLFLHPTGADMVHAQPQDGIGGAGTVPFGRIGTADPHHEPAFRVGGSLALSCDSSIAVAYTFFESNAVSRVDPPIIAGGGGAVGSLVHHPGAAITASAGPVDATHDIDFQLAEAKYRRVFFGDGRGWMNYSVGARYAILEQDFAQHGIFSGGSAGAIDTVTDIDFEGGGALFGVDGERMIGRRGLSLYGSLGVSPIVGQFSSDYNLTNQTAGVQLAQVQWKDDRFVTILDAEVGVAWTSRSRKWRVSSGYLASHWFNTITTPEFVSAVQANDYVDVGDTLSFDGVTTRIERRF